MKRTLTFLCLNFMGATVFAGQPMWTFEPLTTTSIAVPANGTATVQYRVTNQTTRQHTLSVRPIQGITQITTGLNVCSNPFVLKSNSSCILSLEISGSELNTPVTSGPVVCEQDSPYNCYQPSQANSLGITQAPAITNAVINVSGSPLTLTMNGPTGQLTINNTSTQVSATNITSNFSATPLNGHVTETGNTCANVPPSGSCTLTYTPGNTMVAQTNFTIQGTNTNALTPSIAIQSGSALGIINPTSGTVSGGTGFTLTGTGLTGATGITFGGVAATSVTVINSTTVTGVTPSHAAGVVNIVIATPAGGATLTNGYTYLAAAIGQPAFGGTIACLNGVGNNLIAATADNATAIKWGPIGVTVGIGAQSNTDGASNTAAIVAALGNNGGTPYAAKTCDDYAVDSQGNSPCQAGNTCYNDWFLPAGNNTTISGQLNCLYTNKDDIGGFPIGSWFSSTESTTNPGGNAWFQTTFDGSEWDLNSSKGNNLRVRCVRAFTP